MAVMPEYTPGLGEALQSAMSTYVGLKRQKMLDSLQQQGAADSHIAAGDAHTGNEIRNAVDYDFLPAGSPMRPGMSIGAAQPPAVAPAADFQSNLAQSFSGNPPGDGATSVGQHDMGRQLIQQMAARGPQQATVTDVVPNSRITLSNGGSVDPMAGFARQLFLKRQEKQIDTDAAIDQAQRTGVIDKNTADALKARREAMKPQLGDSNFADLTADVANKEAMAKLPAQTQLAVTTGRISLANALAEENARAGHASTLQGNQQQFTAGQGSLERAFRATQQQNELAGQFSNRVGEAGATMGLTGRIGRFFSGAPALPTTGAGGAPAAAPPSGNAAPSSDPRAKAIDAMVKAGMTDAEIKAAMGGKPPA